AGAPVAAAWARARGAEIYSARHARAPARYFQLAGGRLFVGARPFPFSRVRGLALRLVLLALVGRRRALCGRGGLSARRARAQIRASLVGFRTVPLHRFPRKRESGSGAQ